MSAGSARCRQRHRPLRPAYLANRAPRPGYPRPEYLPFLAALHARGIALSLIDRRRLRGYRTFHLPASQPVGMGSVPLLRTADAVRIRPPAAVSERARDAPLALRVARCRVPHSRLLHDLSRTGDPVLF